MAVDPEAPEFDEADAPMGEPDEPDTPPEEDESPPPPVEAGETPVAPNTDSTLALSTVIEVTVRRDFPMRGGEQLGNWAWTTPSGTVQAPLRWSLPSGTSGRPAANLELEPDRDSQIFGWGIGHVERAHNAAGSPGDAGGSLTTDNGNRLEGEIQLREGGPADNGPTLSTAPLTTADGLAQLQTLGRSGTHTIQFVPADAQRTSQVAGPALSHRERLRYRECAVAVELQAGMLATVVDPYNPPQGYTRARVGNRKLWTPTAGRLPLSVKPEWWKDTRTQARWGDGIELLIIHCTGGYRIGPALNSFFSARIPEPRGSARRGSAPKGSDYIIDVDGHVIRLVPDGQVVTHAGTGRWGPLRRIVQNSVGIEIINPNEEPSGPNDYTARAKPPYTPEQYTSLIRLVRELVAAYPQIGRRVVGHCDVRTNDEKTTYGGERRFDPGSHFEWSRLEAAGLGMVPANAFDPNTDYGGVFGPSANLTLSQGDRDAHGHASARYGGEDHESTYGVIAQLRDELRFIGYVLERHHRFRPDLGAAVDRFRRHFAGHTISSDRHLHGSINREVAAKIFNVARGLGYLVARP